jgi:hypothetical protein
MGAEGNSYYGFVSSTVQCGAFKYAIILMWLGADNDIDIVLILYRWAHLLLVMSVRKLKAKNTRRGTIFDDQITPATSLY